MSDVPFIVKELRNEEKYDSLNHEKESITSTTLENRKKDQYILTTEDTLDTIWFNMWKFL
jgi:hypothetical protein